MDDREVAAALRFIREHAGEPIQVQDVLSEVPISRRGLEVRFRSAVGRSIHDQIQRDHLLGVGQSHPQFVVPDDDPAGDAAQMIRTEHR